MKASDSEPAEALRRAQQALTTGDVVTARRLARKALVTSRARRTPPRRTTSCRGPTSPGRWWPTGRSPLSASSCWSWSRCCGADRREAASCHRGGSPAGGGAEGTRPRDARPPRPARPEGMARPRGLVLLVNLPVLHLLVRSEPKASGHVPFSDDFTDPGDGGAELPLAWRVPAGDQRRAALAGDQEQPALAGRGPAPRRGGGGLGAAISPEGEIRVTLFGNGIDADTGYQAVLGPWSPMGSPQRIGSSRSPGRERAPTLSRWLSRARVPGDLRSAGFGKGWGLRSRRRRSRSTPRTSTGWLRAPGLGAPLDGRRPADGRARRSVPARRSGTRSARALQRRVGRLLRRSSGLPRDRRAFAPVAAAPPEPAAGPFSDDFDRGQLGRTGWPPTRPRSRSSRGGAGSARPQPSGLVRKPLPENVVIDLDVWTDSPDGDMKVEVFGDGQSFFRGDPRRHTTPPATSW